MPKLQTKQTNKCCELPDNHEPVFVFVNRYLGFTQFCTKCDYLFLSETQFPSYGEGLKKGEAVDVFEDLKSISPTINILRNQVKYIVFPEGKSDKSLIAQLGVTELKVS